MPDAHCRKQETQIKKIVSDGERRNIPRKIDRFCYYHIMHKYCTNIISSVAHTRELLPLHPPKYISYKYIF